MLKALPPIEFVKAVNLDVSDNIISVSQHTGEIEIETSDIDHVKIIYFIAPAIIKKQINDVLISDEQYVNVGPYAESIYTNIVSENENMLLGTLEASDCTIFPINKIEGIELSKNMIINGRISKTSNDCDVYNISPSYIPSPRAIRINPSSVTCTTPVTTSPTAQLVATLAAFVPSRNSNPVAVAQNPPPNSRAVVMSAEAVSAVQRITRVPPSVHVTAEVKLGPSPGTTPSAVTVGASVKTGSAPLADLSTPDAVRA